MVKQLRTGALMLLFLTLITGLLYPLLVTVVAQVAFPYQANGSLVRVNETIVGSELIGQANSDPTYFWSRPSAISYNPMPSSGSNLALVSTCFQDAEASNETTFREANGVTEGVEVPADITTTSGSGVDPHISPESARLQIDRVAEARGLTREEVVALVERFVEAPMLGFLGEARVNVFNLNRALDALQ